MNSSIQIAQQLEKGMAEIETGQPDKAIKRWERTLQTGENAILRNQLSLALNMLGDSKEAWKTLQPNLRSDVLNPLASAIAATMFIENPIRGRKHLLDGIRKLTWATSHIEDPFDEVPELVWMEWHTAINILVNVAGAYQEYRMVIDLYNKFQPYSQSDDTRYFTGVAHFNVKEYQTAIAVWSEIDGVNKEIMEVIIAGTSLLANEVVPPFEIEFSLPKSVRTAASDQEYIEILAENDFERLLLLGEVLLFEEDVQNTIGELVKVDDHWGITLAHNLINSDKPEITTAMKHGAIYGLLDLGVLYPGQTIDIINDGKQQKIVIEQRSITNELTEQEEEDMERAESLMVSGNYSAALDLVIPIAEKYPLNVPVMAVLGRALALAERRDDALEIVNRMLLLGDESELVRLMAGMIAVFARDIELADECLEDIDPHTLPEDLQQLYYDVVSSASQLTDVLTSIENSLEQITADYDRDLVEKQMGKNLAKQLRLKSLLRTLPVEWLDAIHDYYDLPYESHRKEREDLMLLYLGDASVKEIKSGLSPKALELLDYLVHHDGLVAMGPITRNFGNFVEEDYNWYHSKPSTPLGELMLHGLAFIGTYPDNGTKRQSVAIAREILERLQQ